MKRKSSLRRTAAPIPVALMPSPPSAGCLVVSGRRLGRGPALHGAGAGMDRFNNVMVAGAAAEVAVELLADRAFVELVTLAPDHLDRRHDHAGRAVAALQA